jgi:hypothetical protein
MAADNQEEAVTPSMDDKATPSLPARTTEQYDADCQAGIQRVGKPKDRKDT